MATHSYILHGGGEHARVVLDCLLSNGEVVSGIFDPKYAGDLLYGVPQLGSYREDFEPEAKLIITIGNNLLRKRVAEFSKHRFGSAIHQSAIVSRFSSMGVGNMLLQGSVVQSGCSIANHVIVNTKASVDHDCRLGDFAHIGPGVVLCGSVEVGEGSFIGAGSCIIPSVKIGAWSVIGAGSVVLKDVPEGAVVVGNPARRIK